jgi:hypothetical protein
VKIPGNVRLREVLGYGAVAGGIGVLDWVGRLATAAELPALVSPTLLWLGNLPGWVRIILILVGIWLLVMGERERAAVLYVAKAEIDRLEREKAPAEETRNALQQLTRDTVPGRQARDMLLARQRLEMITKHLESIERANPENLPLVRVGSEMRDMSPGISHIFWWTRKYDDFEVRFDRKLRQANILREATDLNLRRQRRLLSWEAYKDHLMAVRDQLRAQVQFPDPGEQD